MPAPITPLNRKFIASVEAILDIANCEGRRTATALSGLGIAKRYLEPTMQRLGKAGIPHSLRGPAGGYVLGRAPSTITLADILAAVGPPNRERIKRKGKAGSLVAIIADCLDGLASKWLRDLKAISVQDLLDQALEKPSGC
jgi:Rrf2 family protein